MTRAVRFGALALCLLACSAMAEEPFRAMRTLEALQARVAIGEEPARAGADTMGAIAQDFRKQPASAWADGRNVQALALFLFNGGAAEVVRPILARLDPASPERPFLQAALAHAEGRGNAALLPLDPQSFPAELGGHLALAQAATLAGGDRKAALAKLDLARLLLPGSLVEEAALRRSVFLLGEPLDAAAFTETLRRYRARYARSPYAANLERRVVATLVARWPRADASTRHVLSAAIETSPANKRGFWLAIARGALVAGAFAAADEAAEQASGDPEAVGNDRARADLYRTVASLFTGGAGASGPRLERVKEPLSPEDRNLLDAAKRISANILAPMPAVGRPTQGPPSTVDGIIARAETLAAEEAR